MRVLVAAFGDAGHAFPAIALGRGLAAGGHDVTLETWEKWRTPVEELGLRFQAAEQYEVFPPPPPGAGPGAAEAAEALLPLLDDLRPDVVVSDILTLAPSLAAELRGIRRATLVPHLFPVHETGMPFFGFGMLPPRTPVGRAAWRGALPVLEAGLRRGRRELTETRARIGLPALDRFHGGMSEELVLVATYPGLEFPRVWPAEVEVCGPLVFEMPFGDIELPEGDDPLVLVAPSTAHDPQCELIRRCFEVFANEPVRVVATLNGQLPHEPIDVPEGAMLVDWLSYSQLMPLADLVVCHGGHGTVVRAIEAGTPLLVSPSIGDMAENGIRVQWAGCGLTVPGRLRRRTPLRWAARELLANASYARRCTELAESVDPVAAEQRAAAAIERLAAC